MKFYWKRTCSTCRKARKFLTDRDENFEEVDLAPGLTVGELDALIGERDYRKFLNFRNELYRERKMKDNPPTRAQALALMSKNPNLIRRPLLVKGKQILIGFDENAWRA
jgi:Spx/MgsR family transcriptional regulator